MAISVNPAVEAVPKRSALGKLAQLISLLAGLSVTMSVAIYPRMYATDMQDVPHGLMALLMMAMSACYVHGIGFVPHNRVARLVFSPWVAWPLLAYAAWAIATR